MLNQTQTGSARGIGRTGKWQSLLTKNRAVVQRSSSAPPQSAVPENVAAARAWIAAWKAKQQPLIVPVAAHEEPAKAKAVAPPPKTKAVAAPAPPAPVKSAAPSSGWGLVEKNGTITFTAAQLKSVEQSKKAMQFVKRH